jgi:toxin ParE1/3/4
MLPIRWRASAVDDLDEIIAYIAERNPAAARSLRERIESSVLPLAHHPYLYRSGRVAGMRELVAHPNYIVVYRVLSDAVEVVNIVHAARKYP